jgi:hypothetical protein
MVAQNDHLRAEGNPDGTRMVRAPAARETVDESAD